MGRLRALLWVDILRGEIHRYSVDAMQHDVHQLWNTVTAIVPRATGGYAMTMEDTIVAIEGWDGPLREFARIDHGTHPCRMNDAKDM